MPKRQTKVLLQIFFGTWVLALLGAGFYPSFTLFGLPFPFQLENCLRMALFHTSLTLAYMITYSALEADSPSLVMVMAIDRAGLAGLEKERLAESLNDDILVKPRIRDLLLDEMVSLDGGKYRPTRKGMLFAGIFVFYRKILKAAKGG